MPVDEITDDDIANWQNAIKTLRKPNGKPFSDSYLRTIQSQFNSIINYAFSKGYLHHNPLADIKNMGVKDKRVEFWTAEEYERFAYCAMNAPEYYYAYEVLYWCGLREGEMLALTLGDIDLKGATISIKILLQNRVKKDWQGYALPGGHVEPGESFVDAVIREMKEETGLTILDPRLVGVKQFPLEHGRYVVLLFKATRWSGDLISSEEGQMEWIKYSDLSMVKTVDDFDDLLKVMNTPELTEFQYLVSGDKWTASIR